MNYHTSTNLTEYVTCSTDYKYFIENFVKIKHPSKEAINMKLYDQQVILLDRIANTTKLLMANMHRLSGMTNASVGYILWETLFKPCNQTLIVLGTGSNLSEIVNILMFAFQKLPEWMKPTLTEVSKRYIKFGNGSSIYFDVAKTNTGRGLSPNTVFLLDINSFKHIPNLWSSLVASKGKMIGLASGKLSGIAEKAFDNTALDCILVIKWSDVNDNNEYMDSMVSKIGIERWNADFELK